MSSLSDLRSTEQAPSPSRVPHASLEVVPKAKRRTFTAEYKARILREADAAARSKERGALGELLRREGLYSSHLAEWRRAVKKGAMKALGKKRGRKQRDPEVRETERLRDRVTKLEEKLRKAEIIIDVQKKLSTLLGIPLPETEEES